MRTEPRRIGDRRSTEMRHRAGRFRVLAPVPQASPPASSGGVSPPVPDAGARTPRNSQAGTPAVPARRRTRCDVRTVKRRNRRAPACSPRSADFQVCCIAGFQTRWPSGHRQASGFSHAPDRAQPLPIWKSATQQVWKPALRERRAPRPSPEKPVDARAPGAQVSPHSNERLSPLFSPINPPSRQTDGELPGP